MIRAIIFDFNGVIAADETLHLRCFQQALAEHACRSRRMTTTARTWVWMNAPVRRCSSPLATASVIETCRGQ